MNSRTIVISAVNLTSGGPLTILQECLGYLNSSPLLATYEVIALVHDRKLADFPHIRYIELPRSKKHWINRLYYEYVYFRRLSHRLKPYLWLSLHDTTPNVRAHRRVVYMHNSIIFDSVRLRDWKFDKTYILFTLFYKYLYRINIRKNDFYIVQQNWFKESIGRTFRIDLDKVVVARPVNRSQTNLSAAPSIYRPCRTFFFPSLSRPFKNFEVVCQAVEILNGRTAKDFKVVLTIDGTESKYSAWVYNRYKHVRHIEFTGLLDKKQMGEYYAATDCLLFPSRLETWGLPISEFARYARPMILADKDYAREAAEGCARVAFFAPDDPNRLSSLMQSAIEGNFRDFAPVCRIPIQEPYAKNYQELFDILLE